MNLDSVLGYVLVFIINHKTLRYSEGEIRTEEVVVLNLLSFGVYFGGHFKVWSQLQNTTNGGQRDR